MYKTTTFLGVVLALGITPSYSVGQQPSSPQALSPNATAQSPSDASSQPESTPKTGSDSLGENHDRKWHVKLGTISVGASYSRFSGPFYYPYGFYPYDDFRRTWLWDPYWASSVLYPPGYFGYNDGRGEVKLALEPKTVESKLVEVYVDNAYAGTADHLKSIWLQPGAYELSVSSKDHASFHRRIYVLSGRSLKIVAKLNPLKTAEAKEARP
jgi:hypothetical protein